MIDLTRWALPVLIDWSRNRMEIDVLCFEWVFFFNLKEEEIAPEQELRELNEYLETEINWIAEERERLNKKMGVQTR